MKKIAIFITTIFLVFSGVLATPVDFASAQTLPQNAGNASIEEGLKGGCKIWDSSVSICFLSIIYDYVLGVSFMIVGLVANLFDFFLGYTLNSDAYRSDFIIKGWGVIRDISNVAFIFTLLYLAIRHILGMSAKKYIPTLVIVALLLNFSLFFTRVVIDGGNILARAFYNSMVIEGSPNADPNIKNISVAIVAKINPQQLLNEAMFAQELTTGDYSTANGGVITSSTTTQPYVAKNLSDNVGYYATIFILLAAVNFILAWVFFSVMLLMVGRTVGLWFAMIFSPIAFITLAVPGSAGLVKQLSFDSWKDTVLKLSFLAPIFIFFLYLIITFLTIIFSTPVPMENRDTFMKLMAVFIPFAFVITLLFIAKKTATDMAGEIGGTIKNIVGKAAGILGGAALGATAFAGRKVVGGIASSTLKDGNYNGRIADAREKLKNSSDPTQRMLLQKELYSLQSTKERLTNWKKSSFDIRNAGKSEMLGGAVGKLAKGGGWLAAQGMSGFGGKDFTVGKGSDQSRDKFEKEQTKKKLEMAEDQSSVSFRERGEVVENQKRRTRDEIFDLEDQKKTLEKGFEDETKAISDRLDTLIKKPTLTKDERDEMDKLEKRMDKDIPKEKDSKLKAVDKLIEEKKNIFKDDGKLIKEEEKRRRGFVADAVDSRNLWGAMMGVDNKEIAHNIRSGKTSKTDAEKFAELAKKLSKEDESKKTPPSTPPPATGGGGTTI